MAVAAQAREEELSTSTDGVDHRHDIAMRPGRLERLISMLSCRSRCSIGNSVHFHADHVEDVSVSICIVIAMIPQSSPHTEPAHKILQSVHVMIKHDREACKKRGQVSLT